LNFSIIVLLSNRLTKKQSSLQEQLCSLDVTVLLRFCPFFIFFRNQQQTFKIRKEAPLRADNTAYYALEPYLWANSALGLSLIFLSTICKIRCLLDLRKTTYVSSKTTNGF
jgi:hypothetical protein